LCCICSSAHGINKRLEHEFVKETSLKQRAEPVSDLKSITWCKFAVSSLDKGGLLALHITAP
jgi:hypothetical protein